MRAMDFFMVSRFSVDHLHCMWLINFDADDVLSRLRLSRAPAIRAKKLDFNLVAIELKKKTFQSTHVKCTLQFTR